MIVGLILVGSIVGTMSALAVLLLGYSVWIAFCIYSAIGSLSVLVGALIVLLRTETGSQTNTTISYSVVPQQRG